jgi:hypothetical protein
VKPLSHCGGRGNLLSFFPSDEGKWGAKKKTNSVVASVDAVVDKAADDDEGDDKSDDESDSHFI